MASEHSERGVTGRLVRWAALTLAGIGAGVAATLATGAWWVRAAGAAAGGLAGLAAATWINRADQRRDAERQRHRVLDAVVSDAGPDDSIFGILLATRAIAPFRGRAKDLAWLNKWCDDPHEQPVAVVTGPAGVGKTRLVTQFASDRPAPYAAGWLHPGGGESALAAVRAYASPALILVDDAAARPDLKALLEDLAANPAGSPVRVVLVSRTTDPLTRMADDLEERHRWVLDNARLLRCRVFGSPDDHARWFAEAVRAYAAARNTPPPDLPAAISRGATDHSDELMLNLQARALLAVLNSERGRPWRAKTQTPPFDQLADALFRHERRRWREAAKRPEWGLTDLTGAVQDCSIAALALTGAADENQAVATLRRVPDLADASAERLANIARWTTHLYPGDPPWPIRILPDMLAEWFLVNQLTTTPQLARSMNDLAPAQKQGLLVLLAHASDHMPQAAQLFADVIRTDITGLAAAGVAAALTADRGQAALDTVLEPLIGQARWTAESLAGLGRQIPEGLLPRTRAAVSAALVGHVREGRASEDLAGKLTSLGNRLRELGRHQEALAATEEALGMWRTLADSNPAHLPDLARALHNLGLDLRGIGRHQEALAAIEEALGMWRTLADSNPAHLPDLATTLSNLGAQLGDLGRHQEALAAIEEALGMWRTLADSNPAHLRDLATTLSKLGRELGDLGRHQEALVAAEQAAGVWRILAGSFPAYLPDLARTLTNLGMGLHIRGRYQEGVAATEEALGMWRTLADSNPAHLPALATTLSNLGAQLDDLGRHQEGMAATKEAAGMWRTLADSNPAHLPDLARALTNLGNGLDDLGRHHEALAATEEALGMWRTLADSNPAHLPALAMTLKNLGARLHHLGRHQEGVAATEEALGMWRTLADSNPAHLPDLASTLKNLGIGLDALGRHQEARAAKGQSVAIYGVLARADPGLYKGTYERMLREYDQQGGSRD